MKQNAESAKTQNDNLWYHLAGCGQWFLEKVWPLRIFREEQEFVFVQGCVGFEPKGTRWQTARAAAGEEAEKPQLQLG